ncbi:MAG: hypothetical protein GX327_00010 [Epulopiscium sp.]|nr:hypothetical protein [Candidatus Epulonipiscium sp.]
MSFFTSFVLIILGLLFIAFALEKNINMERKEPITKKINNKFNLYNGIVTGIEENEQGQIVKIKYKKNDKDCEAVFYAVNAIDSMIDFKINFSVGAKVSFSLNENGNINLITIQREDKSSQSNRQEKAKIQLIPLFFGMFLFISGIYYCIQNIYWLLFVE